MPAAHDLVALGEVMLRFDPGDGRIATARSFAVSEGGGEYNVARGLRRCFGLRTALVTAFADNPVGRLLEDLILQGGVDQTHVAWVPYDGVGRSARNGLNFVERGFGVRAALGCSDRGHSAAASMRPGDVDWDAIFGGDGARWFHCGGIFAALGRDTAALALEAMTAARRHGTVVSFDLNYRPSLWKAAGGSEAAAATNRQLVEQVDVAARQRGGLLRRARLLARRRRRVAHRPRRRRRTSTCTSRCSPRIRISPRRDLAARGAHRDGQRLERRVQHARGVRRRPADARGSRSSTASVAATRLPRASSTACSTGADVATSLAYGVAHGALAMTTPGDTSMATLAEVERVMSGGAARVIR